MREKQYHIGLSKGDVGKYCILPGDPGRVPQIAKYFDTAKKVGENREFVTYTGEVDGIKISAVSTGIGCPSTAICVEELIKIGADTFIRVGTAGSLQKEIKNGDIVISTGSVREEGTSRQYVPLSYPAVADLDIALALRQAAKKFDYRYHCGITHCKDAFYIEGGAQIPLAKHNATLWEVWTNANVLATSMESAALFSISSIRGVRAGEVMAIIGSTLENKPIEKKAGIDEAIKVAIEAVKILDKQRL